MLSVGESRRPLIATVTTRSARSYPAGFSIERPTNGQSRIISAKSRALAVRRNPARSPGM